MRMIEKTDNAIVWLNLYEQKHPQETILHFFEKNDLGVCRYYLWQMLYNYGKNPGDAATRIDQASCIAFFEDIVCLLEACYLHFHPGLPPAPATAAIAPETPPAVPHPESSVITVTAAAAAQNPVDRSKNDRTIAAAAPAQPGSQRPLTIYQEYSAYIRNAEDLIAGAQNCHDRKQYPMACLQLHQACVQALTAVLIPFLQYKPKSNNLELLMRVVSATLPEINILFLRQDEEEAQLFRVLRKAYNPGHLFKKNPATAAETKKLISRCSKLVQIIRNKYDAHPPPLARHDAG